MFRALLHFWMILAIAVPAFAQVYKWVDERGVTHYGERPPQGRKSSEVPHKLGTPPAPGGTARESAPPQDRPPQQGQPQDQSSRQGQPQGKAQPEPQAAPPLDRQAQDALRRQEQCTQQRDLLARLKQNAQLDVSGAVTRQEKTVADLCKS